MLNQALIEFGIRAFIFLAIFLLIAYLIFMHIEKVKLRHGLPENQDNYMAILKHYFFPPKDR